MLSCAEYGGLCRCTPPEGGGRGQPGGGPKRRQVCLILQNHPSHLTPAAAAAPAALAAPPVAPTPTPAHFAPLPPLPAHFAPCYVVPPPPQCTLAVKQEGEGPSGITKRRQQVWLCPAHADAAVRDGGWSLELGRTPSWTPGGLLHVLSARPLDAPQFPFVPPKVTEIPQSDSGPPAGVTTDLAVLYAPKTDTMMARHLLRKLPEATKAAADRIPPIEAVVSNAPGVEDCCAFIREDTVGVGGPTRTPFPKGFALLDVRDCYSLCSNYRLPSMAMAPMLRLSLLTTAQDAHTRATPASG